MRCEFLVPYYVTPHARWRFGERVDPTLREHEAIVAIQAGLQEPDAVLLLKNRAFAYRARTPQGKRFACVVKAPEGKARWPVVVTVGEFWRWHEFKSAKHPRTYAQRHWTDAESWFVVAHLTVWTVPTIARHLGRTPKSVIQWLWRHHQAPTNQDWLTSGQAAQAYGCTQQWLTARARVGTIKARRVPGGRWWLFAPPEKRGVA